MNSMSGEKLKGIPYTGTLPAVLAGTKAGYLHRYKVYGNLTQNGTPTPENPIVPSECGERTGNLFDKNTASTGGYISASGITPSANGVRSVYIQVKPSTSYYISNSISISSFYAGVYYDVDKEPISNISLSATSSTITTPSNAAYIRINTIVTRLDNCMLTEGSTAPTSYIPYGYKLPLISGSTPVDIYLGDDTLSTEEYVDSSTGKIYRMVGGVLTPTDPPVPFPQIPTTTNSTTIGWAGQGLAPSEFDSIQEWVDISTYTRVNGEWVADN